MPLFCDPSKNKMFVTQEEAAKMCKAKYQMYSEGWEAGARLSDKFRAGPTSKEYLALVDGR